MDETGADIQNEVSQKEKHQYTILLHIHGLKMMVKMTLYEKQQDTQIEKDFWTLWEKTRVG